MSRPIVTTLTIVAGVANGISAAQALAAATALTLNGSLVSGGVAKFDAPRRVAITSAGNDSGITWTVTGTARPEQGGVALTETIVGANAGTAVTTQDFATVTSITSSGATAANVTAGTNGTASGPWVVWSGFQTDSQIAVSGNILSGNPTWTVEYTYDDPFGTWLPSNIKFPRAIAMNTLSGMQANADGGLSMPIRASRLTLNAYGGVQLTQFQQGI